jgi:hypothetical protein
LKGSASPIEIDQKVEVLNSQGITIERYEPDRFAEIRRYDTQQTVDGEIQGIATFVATLEGLAVGWLWEILTHSDVLEEGTPESWGAACPLCSLASEVAGSGRFSTTWAWRRP